MECGAQECGTGFSAHPDRLGHHGRPPRQFVCGYPRFGWAYPRFGKADPRFGNAYGRVGKGYRRFGKAHLRFGWAYPRFRKAYPRVGKGYPRFGRHHQRVLHGRRPGGGTGGNVGVLRKAIIDNGLHRVH